MFSFGRKFESLIDGIEIENAAEDYKSGKSVGQYKLSAKAIYQPDGKYLPYSAIKEYKQDKGSVHVTGCCAGGVMVDRLVLITEEKSFPFQFDSKKAVVKAIEIMNL